MVSNTNAITINHVLFDEMAGADKNPENDLDSRKELFVSGPNLPVKITIDRTGIVLEFKTLRKNAIDNEGDEEFLSVDEKISITVDYFNDKLRIFHNDAMTLGDPSPYRQQAEILVVPSVRELAKESGA